MKVKKTSGKSDVSRSEARDIRRHKIVEIVREKSRGVGELLQELIKAKLGTSAPTLRNDLVALEKEGAGISFKRGRVEAVAIAKSEFDKRKERNQTEKQEIAKLGCALLFGELSFRARLVEMVGDTLGWQNFSRRHLLEGMWEKSFRMAAIDAGTTNLALVQDITRKTLPIDGCTQLSVVTNGPLFVPEFYKMLGVQTIVVGGEMRTDRYSIVGYLAERSLDIFNLVPDVSFIGATGVDMQRGFTSDHIAENQIKVRMLNSRIRCVVMDSSKLTVAGGTANVFCSFGPGLDFVLMDEPGEGKKAMVEAFRSKLLEAKIFLLTTSMLASDNDDGRQKRRTKKAI